MVRKPKYLQSEQSGRERWLISYADVLTVLLILFVAMAAESPGKPRPPIPATTPPPTEPSPSRQRLIQAGQRLQQQGLEQRLETRGLLITLPQAVLFESGDDRVNPAALPMISQIAEVLRDSTHKIELAGYADTVPIHNRRFKNNWELSAARSLSLLTLLVSGYGIDESRLSVSSSALTIPRARTTRQAVAPRTAALRF